jgi:putative ABC transport system permease protein
MEARFGLFVGIGWFSRHELVLLGMVLAAGLLAGAIPAFRSYRYSLSDGMTIRL